MKFPRKIYRLKNGCMTCAKMLPRGKREITPRILQKGKWAASLDGESWRASRLSYHLNVAPISCQPVKGSGEFVLHKCDHEWCINPKHLYLGTIKQNTKDKFDRHPTIHAIMSESSKRAWANRSEEARAKCLSNLYGQTGKPSYERTDENRQRSAEIGRDNWARLTPEQYDERCRRISEGRKRK